MPTRSDTTEHDYTTEHNADVSPPTPPGFRPDRVQPVNPLPHSPRAPGPPGTPCDQAVLYAQAARWLRVIVLSATLCTSAIAAGGLALTAIACAVFALAYLLQGTWLTALALFTGHVLASSIVMLLAGLAKRRTRQHRARLRAALITRWQNLNSRRSGPSPGPRRFTSSGQR